MSGSGIHGYKEGHGYHSKFNDLYDVDIDLTGTFALVTDKGNCEVRKIYLHDKRSETLSGTAYVWISKWVSKRRFIDRTECYCDRSESRPICHCAVSYTHLTLPTKRIV